MIDPIDLESDDLSDEDLERLIKVGDTTTEVTDRNVQVAGW